MDKKCGTCEYFKQSPIRSEEGYGRRKAPVPFWVERSYYAQRKDDGESCPCYVPKEVKNG
jgi:hypothetical protein